MTERRAILVGLDGADWRVLSPLLDAGAMPALRGIVEGGTSGRLLPLDAVGSAVAWATLLTGRGAHVHGVLSDRVPDAGTGLPREVRIGDRAAPTVWEVAAAAGLPAIAVGWGDPFGGEVPLPQGAAPGAAADAVGCLSATAPTEEAGFAGLLAAGAASGQAIHDRAAELLRAGAWRVAAVRFPAFGAMVASFVRFMPPCGGSVQPRTVERCADAVRAACAMHDAWLGSLVRAAGDGTMVFVASERGLDLGMLRHPPGSPAAHPAATVPPGIVAMAGEGIARDELVHGMRSIDVAGRVLRAVGAAPVPPPPPVAFPCIPDQVARNSELEQSLALRRAAYAAAAAACGDLQRARAAREETFRDCPGDAANAAVLARMVLAEGAPGAGDRAVGLLSSSMAASGPAHPLRWILLLGLSRTRCAIGRHDLARLSAEEARTAGAPPAEADLAAAEAALASGAIGESEALCRRALAADPSHHGAAVWLARTLGAAGRFTESIDSARAALAIRWFDPDTHALLGTMLAAERRAAEAVVALETAIAQSPGHPAALRRLAAVRFRQFGDVDGAREAAQAAARSMLAAKRGDAPGAAASPPGSPGPPPASR